MAWVWVEFLKCHVDSGFAVPELNVRQKGDFLISQIPLVYYNRTATVWSGAL
jgi:hypothetical protein